MKVYFPVMIRAGISGFQSQAVKRPWNPNEFAEKRFAFHFTQLLDSLSTRLLQDSGFWFCLSACSHSQFCNCLSSSSPRDVKIVFEGFLLQHRRLFWSSDWEKVLCSFPWYKKPQRGLSVWCIDLFLLLNFSSWVNHLLSYFIFFPELSNIIIFSFGLSFNSIVVLGSGRPCFTPVCCSDTFSLFLLTINSIWYQFEQYPRPLLTVWIIVHLSLPAERECQCVFAIRASCCGLQNRPEFVSLIKKLKKKEGLAVDKLLPTHGICWNCPEMDISGLGEHKQRGQVCCWRKDKI